MRTAILLTILILAFTASFAESIGVQSFEEDTNDNWAYTVNPAPTTRMVFWNRTDQALGGAAGASDGSWYWASWDMDNTEGTLSFDTVNIENWTELVLSFDYYTNGLDTGESVRYAIEYDDGTTWTNWTDLNPDTDAWTPVTVNIPDGNTQIRLQLSVNYNDMDDFAHWDNIRLEGTPPPNEIPIVTGAIAAQRTDGSGIVDITYDVSDGNGDAMTVTVELSDDGGNTYTITPDTLLLSGDVGEGILSGTGKSIVWDAGSETMNFDGDNYVLRVRANDGSTPDVPDGMIYVPGGSFQMGRTTGIGDPDELPLHTVNLDAFYIGTYEVTHQEVIDVYNWAYQQGYVNCSSSTVTNASGNQQELLDLNDSDCAIDWNGSQLVFGGSSYASDVQCPVIEITWYGSVAYCNYLSLQEGLTPCYDLSDWSCDWSANGYRLPTEAEWEYSARGATNTPDYLYAGSDNIDDVAWYQSNSGSTAHPVGQKDANGIGTHDQSGNVWEWCWDWYGSYSSGEQTNPSGPESGSSRVIRGGGWYNNSHTCRVANRDHYNPYYSTYTNGFRLARTSSN